MANILTEPAVDSYSEMGAASTQFSTNEPGRATDRSMSVLCNPRDWRTLDFTESQSGTAAFTDNAAAGATASIRLELAAPSRFRLALPNPRPSIELELLGPFARLGTNDTLSAASVYTLLGRTSGSALEQAMQILGR
jgi:hypothetical protein